MFFDYGSKQHNACFFELIGIYPGQALEIGSA